MLKPAAVVFVLVLVGGAGIARADDNCIKTPFQLTSGMPVTRHATIPLNLTHRTEIEEITVRVQNLSPGNGFTIASAQLTAQLNGSVVTHGIEISPNFQVPPATESDLSRQVKFYADGGSQVVFDVDLTSFTGVVSAQVDVSIVGRQVTAGCWGQKRR